AVVERDRWDRTHLVTSLAVPAVAIVVVAARHRARTNPARAATSGHCRPVRYHWRLSCISVLGAARSVTVAPHEQRRQLAVRSCTHVEYGLAAGRGACMTKSTGVGRGTAKDRAHDYVKRQVLTGAFPGGELISEGEVAAVLGMSRTPVREAFLRLEAEGLLRLYPQRGALVVPVSSEEAHAVIEARRVFERLSGELQRQRDAAAKADWEEFSDADRAFHDVILQESGNVIVAGFYSSLRDRQMRMNREL